MTKYLCADLHFDHENILRYCDRPFKNVSQMNKQLVNNWNSIVGKDDIVYNLGDLTLNHRKPSDWLASIIEKLNGRHILILGNHDKMDPFKFVEMGIESVHTSLEVDGVYLIHDPAMSVAFPEGSRIFCGHVHNLFLKLTGPRKVLNVGCDVWNYTPVEWNQALTTLEEDQ